jgi:hypothetical protein
MTLKMLGRTLLLWSLVSFLPLAQAHSADIDLQDYWMTTAGQWSRFSFSYPAGFPDITVTLTVEKSGDYVGKYRLGNFITPDTHRYQWVIFDWDATNLNLYYAIPGGKFDPPAKMPRILPLGQLIDNPLETDIAWYFIKLNSFTVPGGTFQDVLVWFNLDKTTGPNSVNAQYNLSGLPYGITHVQWYGRGVGELQELEVDADTGATLYTFVLQACGFKSAMPAYLLLLD